MFQAVPKSNSSVKTNNSSLFHSGNEKNSFFQPKLETGKPGDQFEVEADRTADKIIQGNDQISSPTFFSPVTSVLKKPEEQLQQKPEPKEIQEKPAAETITPEIQKKPAEIVQPAAQKAVDTVQKQEEPEQEDETVQAKEEDTAEVPQKPEPKELQEKPVAETITPEIQKKPAETVQPVVQKTEETVQQQEEAEAEEEEPVQAKMEDFPEVEQKPEPNGSIIQAQSDGPAFISPNIETAIHQSKGGGDPLPEEHRAPMESGFGTDFSDVRVHTGSDAVQMSKSLGAQAFTHGNDIFFNSGKFNPSTTDGKHLLAHELTHTIQQGASVRPKMIQKAEGDEAAEVPQTGDKYDLTTDPPKIFIDNLPVPAFKKAFMSGDNNFRAREYSEGGREGGNDPEQSDVWNSNVSEEGALQKLLQGGLQNERFYRVKANVKSGKKSKDFERNGDLNLMAQNLKVPFWVDETGEKEYFQIDHKQELQLKGWPRVRTAGQIDNLFLLSAEANETSGNTIKGNVDKALIDNIKADEDLKNAVASKGLNISKINVTLANQVKSRFDIHYRSFAPDADPPNIKTWEKSKIESGDHIDKFLSRQKGKGKISLYDFQDPNPSPTLPFDPHPAGLDLANQIGSSSSYVLYWGDTLSSKSKISWEDPNSLTKTLSTNMFDPRLTLHGKFFNAESMEFNPLSTDAQKGHLRGKPFKLKGPKGARQILQLPEYFNWPIYRMAGTTYAGFLRSSDLKDFLNNSNAEFELLSPFTIDHIQLGPEGLIGMGTLLPSVPFISKAKVDIIITEDDVRLQKVFSSGDLDMPAPFSISDVSLTLGYGLKNGFFIQGQVVFGIDNVGEGHIGATASTGGGFELEGAFNFDSELFDPAQISVEYKDNVWTIGGQIGIPEGKVRGVKNATITASYSENNLTATGEAELDIPGIERGAMTVNYGDAGFSISGNFNLSDDIPGIRGGNVEARVSKAEGAENYDIFVSGTAQPAIPGIDSSLTVTYDNGALTIEGSAAYSRGMLSGTVRIGATNRAIGDDGQPAGEPDDTMRVYGGGSLTLTLTPWLQATAGVNFLPNGEIEVTGRIALPDTVDVFDRKSIDRNLFSMPAVEIPIFAIPLGPKSIGLVARITGGLDFSAGFGPGQLRELSAEVTYNPDHEEETTITGHGNFVIPADAGLTLHGDLGLGVSVAIASLTGGIEIAGTLGLQGEAAAAVDVNWSPQTGLAIDATGSITVSPKFTFDINAFARATLDLWVTSFSETWRYNLASFSWGPDIQFGIIFPVHYREGEPFDMSFDDIQVIYPDLDIVDMAIGLARQVKDNIFD